jgi:hypothetical protein
MTWAASKTGNSDPQPEKNIQLEQCRVDWQKCQDDEQFINNWEGRSGARSACRSAAEKQHKFQIEWPWLSFHTFGIRKIGGATKDGVAILIASDVWYHNAFGGKMRVEVRCWFDLNEKSVLFVMTD